MTESTFSVNSRAAEKIVKELSKAGIPTSLGARHGDATIININPEQWHNASDIVHRVNAGLSAKPFDLMNVLLVVGVGAGALAIFGYLPVFGIGAAPWIFGAVLVIAAIQALRDAWEPWRTHGQQLPKQTWEDVSTYQTRTSQGKVTRWFSWGCALFMLAFFAFLALLLAEMLGLSNIEGWMR
jgi:hypothetical protein